jgi:hypothetical protein
MRARAITYQIKPALVPGGRQRGFRVVAAQNIQPDFSETVELITATIQLPGESGDPAKKSRKEEGTDLDTLIDRLVAEHLEGLHTKFCRNERTRAPRQTQLVFRRILPQNPYHLNLDV